MCFVHVWCVCVCVCVCACVFMVHTYKALLFCVLSYVQYTITSQKFDLGEISHLLGDECHLPELAQNSSYLEGHSKCVCVCVCVCLCVCMCVWVCGCVGVGVGVWVCGCGCGCGCSMPMYVHMYVLCVLMSVCIQFYTHYPYS